MDPNTAYLHRLRRRMWMGAAQSILGLALAALSFWMPVERTDRSVFAWQLFRAFAIVIVCCGLERLIRSRRVLRGPELYQERGRIEEQDERTQLIQRMAWVTMGRILTVVLFAAMLGALVTEQLAVFWTIYVIDIGTSLGVMLLRRWYGRRL